MRALPIDLSSLRKAHGMPTEILSFWRRRKRSRLAPQHSPPMQARYWWRWGRIRMPESAPVSASLRAAVAPTLTEARTVADILERVIPGASVRVFGSRVTGRSRPFSDLDLLVVHPAPLTWAQRADLRDLFQASDLPFRV